MRGAECGVEAVAQVVRQVVEDENKHEYRKSGEGHLPPNALPQAKPGVVYQNTSVDTADGNLIENCMSIMCATFGRIWRNIMRRSE